MSRIQTTGVQKLLQSIIGREGKGACHLCAGEVVGVSLVSEGSQVTRPLLLNKEVLK